MSDISQTTDRPHTAPQLKILNQYICDLSFENPRAPHSLRSDGEAPAVNVEVGVSTKNLERSTHEVRIDVKGVARSSAGTHYVIELSYAGLFDIQGFTPAQQHQVLFVNCPALLFPFIRQLFGELPRQGGFAPIWLDPIDWGGMYLQRVAEAEAAKSTATAREPGRPALAH